MEDSDPLDIVNVIEAIANGRYPEGFAVRPAGGLMSVVGRLDTELIREVENTDLGHGKPIRKAVQLI